MASEKYLKLYMCNISTIIICLCVHKLDSGNSQICYVINLRSILRYKQEDRWIDCGYSECRHVSKVSLRQTYMSGPNQGGRNVARMRAIGNASNISL
jgi:hypothetical protein